MERTGVQRKLAAILVADMAGYSRLMEADETGTMARHKAHREDLIDPKIAENGGRIVKTMGDGLLVEFASAVDAAKCAVAIQVAMQEREADVSANRSIRYRVGINLGDVVVEGDDLFGNGVNVAARLQEVADPGGITISRAVIDHLDDEFAGQFAHIGARQMKNINRPIDIWQWRMDAAGRDVDTPLQHERQIRFCSTADGVSLALAEIGDGPPLVKTSNYLTHLEYDWTSPIWRPLWRELAQDFRLISYDERGTGLSERDVEDISLKAWVRDLEAVVDAVGVDRFNLLGISQGCPVAIVYAARNPERVSRLVLHSGFARGWRLSASDEGIARQDAMLDIIRNGWGTENPAFRKLFTSLFVPDGNPEQLEWFDELMRVAATPETAARIYETFSAIDVMHLLPQISIPTLVTHCRGDAAVTWKAGRDMASLIPGARFLTIETRNHIPVSQEAEWSRFINEVKSFFHEGSDL